MPWESSILASHALHSFPSTVPFFLLVIFSEKYFPFALLPLEKNVETDKYLITKIIIDISIYKSTLSFEPTHTNTYKKCHKNEMKCNKRN